MSDTTGFFGGSSTPVVGNAQLLANCAAVGRSIIRYGSNLLTNGDMESVSGTGGGSVTGPGWTSGYVAASDITLAEDRFAFFSGNAGSVTNGDVIAATIFSLGSKSLAVNVGVIAATAIISWPGIFLENGKTYALRMDAAIIAAPFGISLSVNGVAQVAIASPTAVGIWQTGYTYFTWAGATGYHTVSLNSNSAAAGNLVALDNIALYRTANANAEIRTNTPYAGVSRAVIDQIVEVTNCNDDRRDQILAAISQDIATSSAVIIVDSHSVDIGAATTLTTAAMLPANKAYISFGFVIIAGTADYIDYDGTLIAGLPAGTSLKWEAPATGKLNPIQSITTAAGSRVVVVFTVK